MKINKKNLELVRKALAVSADQNDSSVSAYLPAPLALQVIEYIRDLAVARKLINTFTQNTRTYTKPKRASGGTAYYIPDGVTATETGFTSTTVQWIAKKLMSYVVVDEEAIEDSQPDLVQQILKDFADAVAEAEDNVVFAGDTTHTATAPDPGSATVSNWYVRDARLAFDGIYTLAAGGSAAASIDAGGGAWDPEIYNKAIYNLGKYGRNRAKLIGIVSPEQAANIRANSSFFKANESGLALASYISGLGAAGEGSGIVTNVYGIKIYEVPFAPTGKSVVFDRTSPELGDRRRIKLANDVVIEQDQRKFVVSERISFNVNYLDALCLITNLSTTLVS